MGPDLVRVSLNIVLGSQTKILIRLKIAPPCLLIDKREAWKCTVCKTSHPNGKNGKPRPWYISREHVRYLPPGMQLTRKPSSTERKGANFAAIPWVMRNTKVVKFSPLLRT